MEDQRDITEDIFGEFGFRVAWEVTDWCANIKVFDITGRSLDDTAVFDIIGGKCSLDCTETTEDAEIYLEGFVKNDGCSQFWVEGLLHWDGPEGYKKHISLLHYIYRRAFELMGIDPEESWD